jgi:serine protease Do
VIHIFFDHMNTRITPTVKAFGLGLLVSVLVITSALGGALADRLFVIKPLDAITKRAGVFSTPSSDNTPTTQILNPQEKSIVEVSEQASRSVVTISIKRETPRITQFSPFGGLFGFDTPPIRRDEDEEPQDIGTGFVVDSEQGLIVTNKHVISETGAEYFVEDKDGKQYPIKRFYRDPANDIGIVKIEGSSLPAMELGDSDQVKVGQFVIAIGTALGEFRHTVTTGVVSGLGRGIVAGDSFGFNSERLDNVIQTDAAINPGNSGGPLLNSEGRVIGVNSAVAGGAENIGFAIPINVIKEILNNFNATGQFDRPFFGVQYQMIPQRTAIMNNLPEGAYVADVVPNSSASEAGIKEGDIITKFDGKEIKGENDLASIINNKKIGDSVEVEYWRGGEKKTTRVTLKVRQE